MARDPNGLLDQAATDTALTLELAHPDAEPFAVVTTVLVAYEDGRLDSHTHTHIDLPE